MWNRYCTVWIEDLTEGSTFSYKLSWSSWQGIQSQHFANAICGCRSHFSAPAVSEGAFSHPLLPGAKPASRRVIFKWRKLSMEYREAQVVRKPRVHDKVAVQGNPCWNKATTKDCFPGGMRGKRYCTFFLSWWYSVIFIDCSTTHSTWICGKQNSGPSRISATN